MADRTSDSSSAALAPVSIARSGADRLGNILVALGYTVAFFLLASYLVPEALRNLGLPSEAALSFLLIYVLLGLSGGALVLAFLGAVLRALEAQED